MRRIVQIKELLRHHRRVLTWSHEVMASKRERHPQHPSSGGRLMLDQVLVSRALNPITSLIAQLVATDRALLLSGGGGGGRAASFQT